MENQPRRVASLSKMFVPQQCRSNNTRLVHLNPSIAAIDVVHCNHSAVIRTLHMNCHLVSVFGHNFQIRDVETQERIFQFQGNPLSLRAKRTLIDSNGMAIVNTKHRVQCQVYRGKDVSPEAELFTIHSASSTGMYAIDLRLEFTDCASGKLCHVDVEGNWRYKDALFYIDVGMTGRRVPVARVYQPQNEKGGLLYNDLTHYHLDIAPGMDMALMVVVCMALDGVEALVD